MKHRLRWLPNALTLGNATLGGLTVAHLHTWTEIQVVLAIGVCLLLDFFDGALARLLNASGPLGKQLDSLADVISFGFLPAAMAVQVLEQVLPVELAPQVSYLGWLILPASALRLGRFNLDEGQRHDFKGLPTPANALFWALLWWNFNSPNFIPGQTLMAWSALLALALSVYFLNAPFWLFSLKSVGLTWKNMRFRLLFLAVGLGIVILGNPNWFWLLLPAYALSSYLHFRQKPES